LPAGTHFVLFSDGSLVADYATLRYLGPGTSGIRVETTADLAAALAESHGPTVTIVALSRVGDMETALAGGDKLPLGTFTPYVTANHMTSFYLFTLQEQPPGSASDAP
jgi:hypothetical protein